MKTRILQILIMLILCHPVKAQYLMDMIDTTTATGRGMLSIYNKYEHLKFSGYIQPQFQLAASKGAASFEGGNFSERISNRFMLRRSRIRLDYVYFGKGAGPGMQFVFQFDANERSFTVRDVWGRIFENRYKLFSLTTGMFARPFGFEVNYSSSDRESPERGRMSQLLMKGERDLGVMLSFDARKDKHPLKKLKIDAGLFNGQGINASGDYDNTKDLIARIALKPVDLNKTLSMATGTSMLYGGLVNNTRYHYATENAGGMKKVIVDSSLSNEGLISPRHYYGADVQFKFHPSKTTTELRAEFITGKQSGTLLSSETPASLLTGLNGYHTRNFNGAYFYLLQQIFNMRHQIVVKYDWYDPNTKVKGKEIGVTGAGLTVGDIRYNTIGFGYVDLITENIKLILYYSSVRNERTFLPGFTQDVKDDVFTCRLQFRF